MQNILDFLSRCVADKDFHASAQADLTEAVSQFNGSETKLSPEDTEKLGMMLPELESDITALRDKVMSMLNTPVEPVQENMPERETPGYVGVG